MSQQSDTATATAGETMPTERFKDWEAILDLQPIVDPRPLRVSGDYFVNRRCGGATLRAAVPQGINPGILVLEVIAEGEGDGGWERVEGRFEAAQGQYESVQVRDTDGNTTSVKITEVH